MERVTTAQAHESAQRLIDVAFGRPDVMARFSIPARLDHDDDLIVTRHIDESSSEIASLRAEVARLEAHADHCATGADHWVSVARALRAEVARLTAERDEARHMYAVILESRATAEDVSDTFAKERDEARAEVTRLKADAELGAAVRAKLAEYDEFPAMKMHEFFDEIRAHTKGGE